MILVIDNYDSFTFNLVQYLEVLGADVKVLRNDRVTLAEIDELDPAGVLLSPGPCTPNEAGICTDLIARFAGRYPILGVCLGHQCIAAAFGGHVVRAQRIMHGKVSEIHHDRQGVFAGVRSPCPAIRYHSLAVERESLPACLAVSAHAEDGEIMGIRHRDLDVEGVQFHPESVLTPAGKRMLGNFLARTQGN